MDALITWVDKRLALAIHERQPAEHGGSSGVRDEKLLESALARPQQLHAHGNPAPDLADLAASLAFGLARNHPFVDGKKRTGSKRLQRGHAHAEQMRQMPPESVHPASAAPCTDGNQHAASDVERDDHKVQRVWISPPSTRPTTRQAIVTNSSAEVGWIATVRRKSA